MFDKIAALANELDQKGQSKLADRLTQVLEALAEGMKVVVAEVNPLGITDVVRMQDKNKMIQQLLGMLQSQRSVNLPPVIADGNFTPQQLSEIKRIAGVPGTNYKTYQELADRLLAEIRKKSPNALLTFRIPA